MSSSSSSASSSSSSSSSSSTRASNGNHKEEGEVWNFAIGSNLLTSTFEGRRRMRPLETIAGFTNDYTVVMGMAGAPLLEPVFAALIPSPGAVAHGLLYRLTYSDYVKLLHSEGTNLHATPGSSRYYPIEIEVQAYDGRIIKAIALTSSNLIEGQVPSLRYMRMIIRGAKEHSLDAEYIAYLESLPVNRFPKALGFLANLIYASLAVPSNLGIIGFGLLTAAKVRWARKPLLASLGGFLKQVWFYHSIVTFSWCREKRKHTPFYPVKAEAKL